MSRLSQEDPRNGTEARWSLASDSPQIIIAAAHGHVFISRQDVHSSTRVWARQQGSANEVR